MGVELQYTPVEEIEKVSITLACPIFANIVCVDPRRALRHFQVRKDAIRRMAQAPNPSNGILDSGQYLCHRGSIETGFGKAFFRI